MKVERLVQSVEEGFNEVSVRKVEGGLVLSLNHRATSDNAVEVFLPNDTEMCFWYNDGDPNEFHAV